MAELRFFFGTMGSGKSTQALQIRHNLTKSGMACMLLTQLDRREGVVSSRLGVSAKATVIDGSVDLHRLVAQEHADRQGVHAVVCDEAQFYQPGQIDQLARLVDELDIEVYAFGLLTSFQGLLFPGSRRLMEVADRRSELQVEARCWCGARATHNARLVNGRQVYEGDLKVVGDTGVGGQADDTAAGPTGVGDRAVDGGPPATAPTVTYDLRCRRHWLAGRLDGNQDSLFDDLPGI
ncbi:MAG: thymidine kinase [Acidimicrobiales bacterium]